MPKGLQGFQKGNKLGVGKKPRLGMKTPLSTREKMSKALKGRKITWGRKISEAKKGIKLTKEHRRKLSEARKGKKPSKKAREKARERFMGEKNPRWKGGITPMNAKIRSSLEYKLWRKAVFERDNYTCRFCGQKGGKLNADHIKPFSDYPELRFAIDNGRTLCENCHKKTDTYLNRWIKKKKN